MMSYFLFVTITLCVIACVFAIVIFKRVNKGKKTNVDIDFEVIVCRDVAEIYCNTVSYLNELCTINKQVQITLEKFISSVSINETMETHQLKAIEDEVNFREKEVKDISASLHSFKFSSSEDGKIVLQKHNLSVAEVASAETCVQQSVQDILNNFMSLRQQLRNNQNNLLGIHFALARTKCFQYECNALYYGALEGMCSFPNDSLTVYYEMAPRWDNMPSGVALKSFDKKHFRMYQEMEFQKSQQCLDAAKRMLDNAENDVDNLIISLKRHDVNFFIAGSKALQQERDVFAGVINVLQSTWKPLGLDINSYSYMNFPRDVTIDGHQQQYNHFIAHHVNVAVFILSGKAGGYTMEEFDVAFDNFKRKGTPKIYVYSLDNEVNGCDSIIHTKMKEEKQYWIEYKNVEELRLLIERDLNKYLIEEFSKTIASLS